VHVDAATLQTLREVFGYEHLRPGQARIINGVLQGQDTLAILPTGAGKSLTFQLPAVMLPQSTLVLSPLIALMKDQVDGLPPSLRERTVLLNSTLSPTEQREVLDAIASGDAKLVYAAPERLRQPAFLRALRHGGVSLVVVDEAHCISLWGHNFRPDYLTIPGALPELGNPPLLAMTATATPETAKALSESFRRELDVVRTSSFRENLYYAAEKYPTKEDKARRVVELCREFEGQGIVYVSSKREAENLAGVLRDNGVKAVHYHAGMRPDERAANQDRYMRGDARVIVATVAFGMGVNKPDVRFIIHFSPATSLEAYAQESGRAGRDGQESRCVLLYTGSDGGSLTRLANRDAFSLDMLREVFMAIKREAIGPWAIMNPSRISLTAPPNKDPDELPDPRIGIGLLELGGLLVRHPTAPVKLALTRSDGVDPTFAFSTPEAAALWEQFAGWIGLDRDGLGEVRIDVAEACSVLQVSPEALISVLDEHPEWELHEGDRLPFFQLLAVGDNAAARLQRVLDDAAYRGQQRVKRMMAYAEGRRCRHVMLAEHLGEHLDPCGIACDVCTGEIRHFAAKTARRADPVKKRPSFGPGDELVTLQALASAPFPVAKTGLTRLLEGSVQSRIQADRSRYFGALSDLQKSKIEAMIDGLVESGQLVYDRSREFPVLRLTPSGTARVHQESD
jgi:ATP-dependent DNA helicase RecQ